MSGQLDAAVRLLHTMIDAAAAGDRDAEDAVMAAAAGPELAKAAEPFLTCLGVAADDADDHPVIWGKNGNVTRNDLRALAAAAAKARGEG